MSRPAGHSEWQTERNLQRLREWWPDLTISTAEIGHRLLVSKSTIIGKAHRLGLPPRPSPIKRTGAPAHASSRTIPCPTSTLAPLASEQPAPQATGLPRASIPPDTKRSSEVLLGIAARDNKPTLPLLLSDPDGTLRAALTLPRAASALVRHLAPPPPEVAPSYSRRPVSCCWPIGEPGTKAFRFCDDIAEPGRSYCGEHCKLAFVRIRDRRDDAEPARAAGGGD